MTQLLPITFALLAITHGCATASEPVVSKGPGIILRALAKYLGKESIEEASEKIATLGGRELFERAAIKVANNGGDEIVERVSKLTLDHGPDVLRALDNAPDKSTYQIIKVFNGLPFDQVKLAAKRLSSGSQGKALAESITKHGSSALKVELAHPGLGPKLMRAFGDDGVKLTLGLSDDYAIALARQSDDLAALPIQQRKGIMDLIIKDKDAFFKWLGDFVNANPGKTVFSMAGTATLLANSENIFGGAGERTLPDGTKEPARTPGLLDDLADKGKDLADSGLDTIKEPLVETTRLIGITLVGALAVFSGIVILKQFCITLIKINEAKLKSENRLKIANVHSIEEQPATQIQNIKNER
ncbi:hypothetical protein N9Z58_01975 [bacterium]|nr:hypothetical protein [bacterium]